MTRGSSGKNKIVGGGTVRLGLQQSATVCPRGALCCSPKRKKIPATTLSLSLKCQKCTKRLLTLNLRPDLCPGLVFLSVSPTR